MGVERNGSETGTNKLNKTNTIDLYRPPALRKLDNSSSTEKVKNETKQLNENSLEDFRSNNISSECEKNNSHLTATAIRPKRERRPDRAFYIPRARRSLTTPPQSNSSINSSTDNHISIKTASTNSNYKSTNTRHNNISITPVRKNTKSRASFPQTNTESLNTFSTKENNSKNLSSSIQNSFVISSNTCDKDKDISLSLSPPPQSTVASLPLTTNSVALISNQISNNCISSQEIIENNSSSFLLNSTQTPHNDTVIVPYDINNCCDNIYENFSHQNHIVDTTDSSCTVTDNNFINKMDYKPHADNTVLRIEDAASNTRTQNDKEHDKEIEEFQRASKEINRSNRCIIKQTFNSNILEIPELNQLKNSTSQSDVSSDDLNSSYASSSRSKDIDPETDDWDSIYDDNGECLDPKIISELSASVGKVKIETPKNDYSAYHIKQSILNDEEFPHVLEVSNFPIEFKTQDLMMIFSAYKESGFDIKWVDDTHALAVFSSSKIAAEALSIGHPFVHLKPLAEATMESRAKAKKCSSSLQPYRQRPETCAALARRLVTGALGVRLKTAAAEREIEKRVLREAKERKLLAAKQRDEAWES